MAEKDFWSELDLTGLISIASRLKRLSELLSLQVQELYDLRGRDFKPSWFVILTTIRREKQIDFKTLASLNNISSPAVSQSIKELEKFGLVTIKTAKDKRSRIISLSTKGEKALDSIIPDLTDLQKTLPELIGEDSNSIIEVLTRIEQRVRSKPLVEILEPQIISFDKKYVKDFEKLNKEWLEEFFNIEDYDKELFANPEKAIIEKGGQIFFAVKDGKAIATLALIPHGKAKIEMSKMTVAKKYRGRGIAQRLLNHAVKFAKISGYEEIFASTNSKLVEAVHIYKKNNFTRASFKDPRYKRVDEKYTMKLNS